jgi:hypothetical protein
MEPEYFSAISDFLNRHEVSTSVEEFSLNGQMNCEIKVHNLGGNSENFLLELSSLESYLNENFQSYLFSVSSY